MTTTCPECAAQRKLARKYERALKDSPRQFERAFKRSTHACVSPRATGAAASSRR